MPRIYDNIKEHFTDGLQGILRAPGVKRADFCVGYFNLRGWDLILNEIDNLPGDYVYEGEYRDQRELRYCRLLVGMLRPDEELIRDLYSKKEGVDSNRVLKCKMQMARHFRRQLLIGLPTKKDEWTLRRLATQLKEGKLCVKLYLREPLHAKLYLAHRPEDFSNPIIPLMGSSNLTYSGLSGQGELDAEFGDSDSAKKLYEWFDDRWNDRFCVDITEELCNVIDESWAADNDLPPYYIYLKTAYHMSEEARAGLTEFALPPEFQHDLFDFQKNAVTMAAKYLSNDKRRGAMIGDVVGLGKTITACAIAKIYEQRYGCSSLIVCPANLQDMWLKYKMKYDLKADIWSMQKPVDMEKVLNYRLVIVDESHNLRNANSKRAKAIRELISKLDCKTLLLTATPYNKEFRDLGSQLRLFLDPDQDLGIRPENYIKALGGEHEFIRRHNDIFIRSIAAFEKSESADDWSDLMKLFLVRRTRTFVKNNYAQYDPEKKQHYLQFPNGTRSYFPERRPLSVKFKTEKGDQYSRLYSEKMMEIMTRLVLPRYGLSKHVSPKKAAEATASEKAVLDNLSKAGQRMMGFCLSTFFKRMDSCGFSFLLTLKRHILRNALFVYAIDEKLKLPIRDENALPDDYSDDEDINGIFADDSEAGADPLFIPNDPAWYRKRAQEHYGILCDKGNVQWIDCRFFKPSLRKALIADNQLLLDMINLCGRWDAEHDEKLNELARLLTKKHPKEKVVLFTQYSDTAKYIRRQLEERQLKHIGIATGQTDNTTPIVERFSPVSNDATDKYPESEQTRVLVATDVLSEGQNLQDAHIIVNYDLPWAIIRLIQRAGRVDRIGQQNETIDCYSFFPADGVDSIIHLRERLNNRINEAAAVVGSDEVFFEGNEQNLRDMFNEKNGVLDDDDDGDVDICSYAYQIWKNATEANPDLKKIIPSITDMAHATKAKGDQLHDGVITYARTASGFDSLSWYDSRGEVVSQSPKRILDAMACPANEKRADDADNHYDLVRKAVENLAKNTNSNQVSGALGNRFSTRYKVAVRLEDYNKRQTDLFFTAAKKAELTLAIDDIYNYPLLESTKEELSSMLRHHMLGDDEDFVNFILELRSKNRFCRINEDEGEQKDAKIICSMGLLDTNNNA